MSVRNGPNRFVMVVSHAHFALLVLFFLVGLAHASNVFLTLCLVLGEEHTLGLVVVRRSADNPSGFGLLLRYILLLL